MKGGDIAGLFARFEALRQKAQVRQGKLYPVVVVQEAGLDGFWIKRVLAAESWIESYVVDAASIAVPCASGGEQRPTGSMARR